MKKWFMLAVLLLCAGSLFGQSLLDIVKSGTPEQVQAAIDAGAKLDDRNIGGMTPLMWAAELNKNPEVITTLLKVGANGKLKDNSGKTAFDYAKDNAAIVNTTAYWELNNARF